MQASHELSRVSVSFDEPNLVSHAGLVPVAELAQRLQVGERIDAAVTVAGSVGANSGAKALTLIGSVLAGGDCIDDVNLLRSGALPELFDGVRAPSTVGSWLRALRWGHVRQLDAVVRTLLVQAWRAGAGPAPGADVTVDLDSTICEVYGLAKQGAARATPGCAAITRCWPAAPVTRPVAAPPSCCTPGCAAATPARAAARARSLPRCWPGCATPYQPTGPAGRAR